MQAVHIAIVAGAGAVGALARWGTSILMQSMFGKSWPVGTLVVNVLGCFVFGIAFEMTRHHFPEHPETRLLWLTGFCGAFTTFSTFAFDVLELHSGGGIAQAALAVGLHLTLGIAAIGGGLAFGRFF